MCIMCEWHGDCCPPCDCQIVNGLYYPSRYQCALDNACMQNMPHCGSHTCKPIQKYTKRNGLSDENLRSNMNGYPNQRRSKSAQPRRCVCCNKNGNEFNEEKFSNMIPPSFLCANVEPKKKQQKSNNNNNGKESDCCNECEESPDLLPINCFISRDGVEKLCKLYKIGNPPCSCACCCRKEESPSFVVLPMTAPGGNHQNGARMSAQVPNSSAPPRASTKKMNSKLTSATIREIAGQSARTANESPKSKGSSGNGANGGGTSPYEEYKQKIEDCTLNCCGPLKTCACEPTNCIDKVPVQTEVPYPDYDCKEDGQKVVCCLNIPGACYNRNKGCIYPPCCNVTITGAEPIDPPNDSLFDMKRKSKDEKAKDGDPSGGCDCGGNTDCICTKGGGDDEKGWCCPWYMYGTIPVQPPRGNLYNYFRTTCCSHCWPCSNAAYTSLGQIQQRQEQQRQAFSLCKAPGNAYDQMVENYKFYNKQQAKSDSKEPSEGERINAGATTNNTPKPAPKPFEFPTIYTGNPMGLAHDLYAPSMPWQQSCQIPGGGYVMIGNKCNPNTFSNWS